MGLRDQQVWPNEQHLTNHASQDVGTSTTELSRFNALVVLPLLVHCVALLGRR